MKTLIKDIFREIKASLGRFISIILIIVLGVGFFAGIKATAPDMKNTADDYFDEYNLMDFRLISTMGFNDDDIKALRSIDGIDKIMESYSLDALIDIEDKDVVTKIMSLPKDYNENLNTPVLMKGRMPTKADECVLEDRDDLIKEYEIGSKIKIDSGKDEKITVDLKRDEYKVVGFVRSPMHITAERGPSKIGNGRVSNFMLISESEFKSDYYTDVYLGIDKDIHSFSDEYKNILEELEKEIEEIGEKRQEIRLVDIEEEIEEKLEEGRQELDEEREKGQAELNKAKDEIDSNKSELIVGERLYNDGVNRLNREIESGKNRLDREERNLEDGEAEYKESAKKLEKERPILEGEIKSAEEEISKGEAELAELDENIKILEASLEEVENEDEKIPLEGQIAELKGVYDGNKRKLDQAKRDLEIGKNKLLEAEKELENARNRIDFGKKEIEKSRRNLESEKIKGLERLEKERSKLDSAKMALRDGEKEYEEGLKKFRKEISKGEREIKKLERDMKNLEKPAWYIIPRDKSGDYIEYEMGADRIDSVAKVFPLFFFLIALLVCLTTMTRMVDEQRGYIGTLKALGYGNKAIMSKYLIYSLSASIIGSIVGLLIGFKIFPTVIFNAYRILFIMPSIKTEFNMYYAINSTVAAIITTSLATFLAVRTELKETTADLMRPKAPKIGKRIFLEKIEPIWSKLKFSQKVTARNIFRYKRRLYMTVIGIAGCTALIVAGFGLKDSIMDITSNQFNKVFQYEMSADINDGLIDKKKDPVIKFLKEDSRVDSYILGNEQMAEVEFNDKKEDVNFIVTEDGKDLDEFIRLRDRETEEKYKLDNDTVIITEKMSDLLDLKIGDKMDLIIDNKRYSIEIGNIIENYAFHYVYMSETLYGKVFYETPEFNKIFIKTNVEDIKMEEELSKDILEIDDVSSVELITGLSDSLNDTMGSLNYVIIVLIVTAGALAFIVLYNLTNINIGERIREIATIKVLGFYDREVSRYVYRENNILTILGTILGLFLGFLLHKFIIYTVEIDMIMFGQSAKAISYVYSAVLTIVFSQLVNFVMYYKLKEIDMVESLKSVD